jgi:hypothetical protein
LACSVIRNPVEAGLSDHAPLVAAFARHVRARYSLSVTHASAQST